MQVLQFVRCKCGSDIARELIDLFLEHGRERAGLARTGQQPCAAILGIGAALDQARLDHTVDHAAQGDGFDFQRIGIMALLLPFVGSQNHKQPRLRAGYADFAHPFVKQAAHMPGAIRQKISYFSHGEAKYNKCAYYAIGDVLCWGDAAVFLLSPLARFIGALWRTKRRR